MTRWIKHAVRRTALAAAGATLVSVALVGCSGDEVDAGGGPAPTGEPTPTPTPTPEPIVTNATINRVDGDLAASGRDRLRDRVLVAVDAWIDGAYGGSYPRDDFSEAFASFTSAAGKRAIGDQDLMSNASIGEQLDAVLPVRRRLRIDVLGVEGRAVAVTAQVVLGLELSGEITRRDRIAGSLYLTYEKSGRAPGWRVFGYDVSRKAL